MIIVDDIMKTGSPKKPTQLFLLGFKTLVFVSAILNSVEIKLICFFKNAC